MIDKTIWDPILERLRAVTSIQVFSREREMIQFYLEELRYRLWHQTIGVLPRWCYATDIDFVELDGADLRPRAMIEVKSSLSQLENRKKEWQIAVYSKMAEKLKIPFGVLTFTPDLKKFLIEQISPFKQTYDEMTEKQYIDFQIKLHQHTPQLLEREGLM